MPAILMLLFFVATVYVDGLKSQRRVSSSTARRASVQQSKTKVSEYSNLIKKLRAHGATAQPSNEKVSQPFFSVAGRIANVHGKTVQVFEYASRSAMNKDANRVRSDGMTIGGSKPSWMAPPHFFKSHRIIVLYVGSNDAVLKTLQSTLGDQFAGG